MPASPVPAQSPSRVDTVSSQLRDEILRGQYRPGERLPSERDLAARFETNRGAIREALKKLEQLGIASIQPGGVRVVPLEQASLSVLGPLLDLQAVPNPVLVGHLIDVLGALIAQAGRFAVNVADADQIREMQDLVQQLIDQVDDLDALRQHWRTLALLFAAINDNLVLKLILNGLKTQFMGRLGSDRLTPVIDAERQLRILNALQLAIGRRDTLAVASAISQHFDLQRTSVQAALENQSPIGMEAQS